MHRQAAASGAAAQSTTWSDEQVACFLLRYLRSSAPELRCRAAAPATAATSIGGAVAHPSAFSNGWFYLDPDAVLITLLAGGSSSPHSMATGAADTDTVQSIALEEVAWRGLRYPSSLQALFAAVSASAVLSHGARGDTVALVAQLKATTSAAGLLQSDTAAVAPRASAAARGGLVETLVLLRTLLRRSSRQSDREQGDQAVKSLLTSIAGGLASSAHGKPTPSSGCDFVMVVHCPRFFPLPRCRASA